MRCWSMEGREILAEIIPFVNLTPIVLPERLSKKVEEERLKAEQEEREQEEEKIRNIRKDFELGERLAREKVNNITQNSHK